MDLPTLTVGVDHAEVLLEFARVATSPAGDDDELVRVRTALVEALGESVMVDAAAVVANFEMMTRLAEGTGSVLHNMASVRAGTAVGADGFKHHG
ncbi:MAG: hypothetical protein F2562_09140 [Actinobacteria bacterium]|nr:hypothetical protein [Actinomycetota bacterium]